MFYARKYRVLLKRFESNFGSNQELVAVTLPLVWRSYIVTDYFVQTIMLMNTYLFLGQACCLWICVPTTSVTLSTL